MKNIKNFEQFSEEEINEGFFKSNDDYENAMKKWRPAFGYYYENGNGLSFMKTMIKGLKDKFKSNKDFLVIILKIFTYVQNSDSNDIVIIKNSMPHLKNVAENYNKDPHYYDNKAAELLEESGIELTYGIKNKLNLKVTQTQGQSRQQKQQQQQQQKQQTPYISPFDFKYRT